MYTLTENPAKAKRMSKIRSKTVEPVLGTLLNFVGMRRVNPSAKLRTAYTGIKNANKHPSAKLRTSVLMSALTYTLKKLLKWNRKTAVEKAVELNMPETNRNWTVLGLFWLNKLFFEVQTIFGLKKPNVNIATH